MTQPHDPDPPEREVFFLHWETSMALELAAAAAASCPPDQWSTDHADRDSFIRVLIGGMVAARWPDMTEDRRATVVALASQHLQRAELDVLTPGHASDVARVAIAGIRAARKAAECMEALWLDIVHPEWKEPSRG